MPVNKKWSRKRINQPASEARPGLRLGATPKSLIADRWCRDWCRPPWRGAPSTETPPPHYHDL